jgi:phosphoglucosamine mutase
VRGVANRQLTPELALALGRAAGVVLARSGPVVVGRDTRVSGSMLEGALVAGLCSAGTQVRLAGVIPTPGVAFLTIDERAAAGAMISASHNPVADNGIKFFSPEGVKLSAGAEEAIEDAIESDSGTRPEGAAVGTARPIEDALDRYVGHLMTVLRSPLAELSVVLDCAFGAAHAAAPLAFTQAGAEVLAINHEPDGNRINVGCGSTAPEGLAKMVVAEGADLGLAFDGDADRVLAIDERGELVDGDRIIALAALKMHEAGELANNVVVSTVMANLGFRHALQERGIDVIATPVGDKFVAEAMSEHGAVVGGEQSGHIIFAEHSTTGDGVLTGLKVAEIVAEGEAPLSKIADIFETYPQVLVNVEVSATGGLDRAERIWQEVARAEARLGDDGRVLLRPSGTEPVVRVMVEAADEAIAAELAAGLADVVKQELDA